MATTPEGKFKSNFCKSLRKMGYVVLQYKQDATTRAGTPDTLIFKEQFWGWLEFKKSKNASKRPGQDRNIALAKEWSYGAFVYPENADKILKELEELA